MSSTEAAANAADVPEPPCFSLTALIGDLRPHPELDLDTLAYHLTQSDATAVEGYWHAAINEARSFLEALLVSIVRAVRPDAPDKSNGNGSNNGMPFRCYRRSLMEAGFIDIDENELLQYVYGVASAKGSHHGVTNEAWSRLARRMVFITGQYMIQHYGAWKSAPGTPPPLHASKRNSAVQRDSTAHPRVPLKSRLGRCLLALTRLLTRDVI